MISIFVATSGRPKMFGDMLQSLIETIQGYEVEVCAAIDNDKDAWDIASTFGTRVWYKSERRGALQAWNDALSMTKGDVLVPTGDDQIFHPDWLKYALESHQDRLGGFGVVGMNDLAYKPPQVATMWLFDRQYCKDVMGGIFAPPCYHYYCVDSEWNEKAKSLGHFYWDERSKVEHLHSAHGKRPVDVTDSYKDDKWMEEDNNIFTDRKARGFPIEWQPII